MNDEGWRSITPEKFEAVCKHLASDDEIWVATFKEMSMRLNQMKLN